jgi:ketosteroid isomerase-like protein
MYTEDAELLIPEAPIFRGREAIRGVWANIVGSGGNTVRVATLESQDGGDWTYEVRTLEVSGPSGDVLNAVHSDLETRGYRRNENSPRHLQLGHSARDIDSMRTRVGLTLR